MLDSAVVRARRRPEGATSRHYGYMVGQRVRPLLRLGREREAMAALDESERVLRRLASDDIKPYLADVALWRGELAFSQGKHVIAEQALRDALRRTAVRLPPGHPKRAGIACLLGVTILRQGRRVEARDSVTRSCAVYARWGLADSMTIAWTRMSTSHAERRPEWGNEQ